MVEAHFPRLSSVSSRPFLKCDMQISFPAKKHQIMPIINIIFMLMEMFCCSRQINKYHYHYYSITEKDFWFQFFLPSSDVKSLSNVQWTTAPTNIFMGDVRLQEGTLYGIYNSCDACFLLRSWFIKDFLRSPPVSVSLLFFPFLAPPPPPPVGLQISCVRYNLLKRWDGDEWCDLHGAPCEKWLLACEKFHYATLVIVFH